MVNYQLSTINCQLSIVNCQLKFVATLVGNSQLFATFCATRCQYAATVCGGHSLQEAVFVTTLALGWLECTFHCLIVI